MVERVNVSVHLVRLPSEIGCCVIPCGRSPNIWGSCGPATRERNREWPSRNTPIFHIYYSTEFGCFGSNRVVERRKNSAFVPGLSRSLKVIRTDIYRLATYVFLLAIHNNHESISCHFQVKRRFMSKMAIFLTPCTKHSFDGVPIEIFVTALGIKN